MSLIIKIDEIKSVDHLGKAIKYILNEKKTEGLSFSNSGIEAKQITDTFLKTKEWHPNRGNRQAYHYKFSFSKDESISAKEALEFIKEWVEKYLGDDYDYVFSVHQDRDHMHMHLVFNSVCRNGGKFRHNNGDWDKIIKPLTNRLAEKHHTGPLKEKDLTLDYSSEIDKKSEGLSWKEKVQRDMDECIKQSKSYGDFKRRMVHQFHYQLREGVSKEYGLYLALTPPGRAKAIRTYRLDSGYMPEDIDKRIRGVAMPPERRTSRHQHNNMDWAMGRNYTFIPYKELSVYQKQMVRQTLEAKRLYARTGTSLQMHEQSVKAIKEMTKESKNYGTIRKNCRNARRVQNEIEQKTKKKNRRDLSENVRRNRR